MLGSASHKQTDIDADSKGTVLQGHSYQSALPTPWIFTESIKKLYNIMCNVI